MVAPDYGRADQHRLGRCLKGIARAIVLFQILFGLFEIGFEAEVLLNVGFDVGQCLDHGELVDGLRVVGDGAVAIHGDGHRSHAQEAEGHQAESEYCGSQHQGNQPHGAHVVADTHQSEHGESQPVGAEVAGHKSGEDIERCAAFPRTGDDLAHVARTGGREDLDELRDERAGQGAATDNGGQLPPQGIVAAEHRDHHGADDVGEDDREDGREPDQRGERGLEVELLQVAVARFGDGAVDKVADRGGDHHHDAHGEDPYQKLDLHHRVLNGQEDEGDERDAGDAVGFETVGRRSNRIAGVVTGAIGNDARVAGIVFLDLENDLHQVAADIGDLGEDTAGHAEGRGAERFTDGEADKAGAGQVARNEQQDEEHDQQFHRDQQHPDAHACLQRNVITGERFAGKRREGRARVGERVHAHAEGRDAKTAGDADHTEGQDDRDFVTLRTTSGTRNRRR